MDRGAVGSKSISPVDDARTDSTGLDELLVFRLTLVVPNDLACYWKI